MPNEKLQVCKQLLMIPSKALILRENSLPLWSVVIPSWNNLEYLQLCVMSLREHSQIPLQILVHVNEGNDGTAEWCKKEGIEFSFSSENIGICYAVNMAGAMAKGEYLVYMNDDMYVLPGWDTALWEQIKKIGHTHFFLSSTLLEPVATGNPCVIAPADFGQTVETFNEKELLKTFRNYEMRNWFGATWPPNIVHISLWHAVGGYSAEFSPGMYSDPDFSMKLWHAGVRVFAGIAYSRIYHFMSKSTLKLNKKNDGKRMFLNKWGISNQQFRNKVILTGKTISAGIVPIEEVDLIGLKRKGRYKLLWYMIKTWFK
jgi:GT2 family glycosyltransferase